MSPLCRRTVVGRGCRGLGCGPKRSHRARSSPRRGAYGPSCPTPTGTAHPIIECPARPRAIWVEGKNSLQRGGALAASSLWAHSSRVCVWVLGPVVQDSQCHQEQGRKNRPEAGSRAGDNCSCLSLKCPTEGLVAKLPFCTTSEQLSPHSGSYQNTANPGSRALEEKA